MRKNHGFLRRFPLLWFCHPWVTKQRQRTTVTLLQERQEQIKDNHSDFPRPDLLANGRFGAFWPGEAGPVQVGQGGVSAAEAR